MLKKNEFNVLVALLEDDDRTQRAIAEEIGVSVGTVNASVRSLKSEGLLDEAGHVTEGGRKELEPYRVDNAILMAAGMSTRFAPLSYEKPKGLMVVRGEVLIERQIRQLQEAGIDDITVVVGYMKEQFFYLEERFGVKIRVNEEYAERNNNSTLMLVRAQLGNTFICSSDDYFTENPFRRYEYQAYYAAVYFEGPTEEYCLTTGSGDLITHVTIGGSDAYAMSGHAYFDRDYSRAFVRILEDEYNLPETAPKLWEDIYAAHVRELPMVMRAYAPGIVNEFDSLDEVASFDPEFIDNVDSSILDNICSVLEARRADISGISPIKKGLTNLSFRFACRGESYVYRHPGAGTDAVIERASEAFSQGVAHDLGLDDTFIYESPEEGWKISRFVPDSDELDYHSDWQVAEAMRMARKLHESGVESAFSFDVYDKTLEIAEMLDAQHRMSFEDYGELADMIEQLHAYVEGDGVPLCLCHNDFYAPNFLVAGKKMYLIDWEYSGMSDYASDLGTFVCCSDYDYDEAIGILPLYFGREPSDAELAHCVAYFAMSSYYWFVWALYKDACGAPVGEWLYLWYKNAKIFGRKALELR